MKKIFLTIALLVSLVSCKETGWTTYEDVDKLHIGMSYTEVEQIMPNMNIWSFYAPNEMRFGHNFWTEVGGRRTVWIILQDSVVTDFYY